MMKRVRNGEEFKKARELLGLTLTDVAVIMRLARPQLTGRSTVARWEKETPNGPAMLAMEALLTGWRPINWKPKND